MRGDCEEGVCSGGVTLPFFEDFEGVGHIMEFTSNTPSINGLSGEGYKWFYEKAYHGRLRFKCDACPYESGSYAAAMDANPEGTYSQNYLILELDLSDYVDSTSLNLYFNYTDTGDESHNRDRVYIRGSNTNTWVANVPLNPGSKENRVWYELTIDIDEKLSRVRQSVSSTFQVSFGQFDNSFIRSLDSGDGIISDDIKITNS